MNIVLPPFPAFVPESSALARPIGEGHTLTLALDLTPVHSAWGAMSGSVSIDEADRAPGMRAAVVAADASVLTLTF